MGSHVEELEAQVMWYQGNGFSTISTTFTNAAEALKQKQMITIARELEKGLADKGKLVIHMCSHHGTMCGTGILQTWEAGQVPFDRLPPVMERLAAMIFDCAPACPLGPNGEVSHGGVQDGPPAGAEKLPKKAEEDVKTLIDEEVGFYRNVLIGCVGGLCKKWTPEINIMEFYFKHKSMKDLMTGASRFVVCGEGPYNEAAQSEGKKVEPTSGILGWEHLDRSQGKPVPRLFLYSQKDGLVDAAKVEAYARHTARYNPKAEVLIKKVMKSPHCRLWDNDELEECVNAASELLAKAGLLSMPHDKMSGA